MSCPGYRQRREAFPGVRSVTALRKQDAFAEALFVNVFESAEAAETYFAWRRSTGALEQLQTLLEGPPRLDFWSPRGRRRMDRCRQLQT
jgi:quinol monooxygenase YgiN